MPTKSPLSHLPETLVGGVKEAIAHPVGTAEKAIGQARGALTLGRAVAGQVAKGAAGAVTSRLPGHHGGTASPAPVQRSEPAAPAPVEVPAKKAPAKKAPAKQAPATQTAVRPPVTDVATEMVKEQAAHQPVPAPEEAPQSPIDAAADPAHVDATPADVAKKVAKKAPAAKSVAKKAPAKKAPAKKAPAKKATTSTPSAKLPARKRPAAKSAAEVVEDTSVQTPVGTTGADVATNPSTAETDLQQPGTEPLVDPATVKAVASEAAVGARGADPEKG
ncbi:hypothetical protein [Nocardioides sp.]|uniref:hypothetical protein n=1 Tax=Nocardioides sp. TaxID=35761 RepID=UPI003784FD06